MSTVLRVIMTGDSSVLIRDLLTTVYPGSRHRVTSGRMTENDSLPE